MIRGALFAAVAGVVLWVAPVAGQRQIDCQRCHGEPELLRQYVETLDEARSLTVGSRILEGTAHAGMDCAQCHSGYTRYPHPGVTSTATCAGCHEEVAAEWEQGLHSGGADSEVVMCADCHGIHDVAPADSLRGGSALRFMSETCAACHETQRLPVDAHHQGHAGCYACHDPHGVRSPSDPESWMAPLNQPQVCGACHDSVATIWESGIHARALRAGDHLQSGQEPPSCTACHGAHPVAGSGDVGAFEASLNRCAECHQEAAQTYRGSYHGKAAELGSDVSATCADCHGAHGMLPADDPTSRVAEGNLVETCSACHDHARPGFVKYDSHPDPMNRERNPVLFYAFWFMNSMLIGTLTVFGLHTILWWIRMSIDKRRGVSHHGGGHGE